MSNSSLRVVFLAAADNASTRQCIEAVCRLPRIEPVGLLLDTEAVPFRRRVKNLARNIRSNGWRYPISRAVQVLYVLTTRAVRNAAVSRADVRKILKESFPESCFSLEELSTKFGMQIHSVGNLNGTVAIDMLAQCEADLGVVLGTRILKSGTFTVPRMGCINLHKGKVPEYRGMPPGFWELFDGESSAGVTVHFVDKGLDTGDIVATSEVPILKKDTPETLSQKLDEEGQRLLATAVSMIREGTVKPRAQRKVSNKPRTKPTWSQVAMLQDRLSHWKSENHLWAIVRNLYLLFVYYSGLYFFVRIKHQLCRSRAAIFLHHRVNDYSKDLLTVDRETFAGQLAAISRRYRFSTTSNLVDCIRHGRRIKPTTIAVHFDDCYRDILQNGVPILRALSVPACAFVNSGFVDTDREYPHDVDKYPFQYPKLQSSDLRAWTDLGFDVGGHTVNHADLGRCSIETAEREITRCGKDLTRILGGRSIKFFSFPFGRRDNITPEARNIVEATGYEALFSAHGGFIDMQTDPFDIPRIGASWKCSPLYCLLAIEGLTMNQVGDSLKELLKRPRGVVQYPKGVRATG